MAFDEALAGRIRQVLRGQEPVTEKRMFGGIAFLVNGHMCCGVVGTDLMVRVGPADYAASLQEPHAREMDFTGRPLKGFVYVSPQGSATSQQLTSWVERSLRYAGTLPVKKPRFKQKKR
ncbi:MAG: TfoX/Sxy family protein [Acidobacteriota bacterium]